MLQATFPFTPGQTLVKLSQKKDTEITWADSHNPFQDRVSAPVTAHICYGNDLGQLGVDLNAVIEC